MRLLQDFKVNFLKDILLFTEQLAQKYCVIFKRQRIILFSTEKMYILLYILLVIQVGRAKNIGNHFLALHHFMEIVSDPGAVENQLGWYEALVMRFARSL